PKSPAPSPRAYFAWIAVCLIWGTTYLAIRISLETIPPLLMAAMRWIVAGGLLIALLKLRGERLPARREWPVLTMLGVLLLGLGLVVGFAGIVMLVWPEIRVGEGGRAFLAGVVSAQIACIGWAIGSSYARHRGRGDAKDENVLATAAFEMLLGGFVLLVVSIA